MPKRTAARFQISDVIRNIAGHGVIPIDMNNIKHRDIVKTLKEALNIIVAQDNIFYARRPNDVSDNTSGECLEDRIVRYFNSISQTVRAARLREKGYPNLQVQTETRTSAYIEIKVTSTTRESKGSARDFFISPGSILRCRVQRGTQQLTYNFDVLPGNTSRKIKADVPHLLVLCIAENLGGSSKYPGYNDWKLLEFKIYDLVSLNLKTKIEFNASYQDIEKECNKL